MSVCVCIKRELMGIIHTYTYVYRSYYPSRTCDVGDLRREIINRGEKIDHISGRLFENVLSIKNNTTFTRPRAFNYPSSCSGGGGFFRRQVQPPIPVMMAMTKRCAGYDEKKYMCTSAINFAPMKAINIIIHAYTCTHAFGKIFSFLLEFTVIQIDKHYYYYFGLTAMQNVTPRIYPYRYTVGVICARISCL